MKLTKLATMTNYVTKRNVVMYAQEDGKFLLVVSPSNPYDITEMNTNILGDLPQDRALDLFGALLD